MNYIHQYDIQVRCPIGRSAVGNKFLLVTSVLEDRQHNGEMGQKLGIDLSHKTDEELGYIVFSVASDYKHGSYAMQGKYFGSKASAAVGVGLGAQVLIGGFEKSFTLLPIAVGGVEGIGASCGMGYLYLQKDPTK